MTNTLQTATSLLTFQNHIKKKSREEQISSLVITLFPAPVYNSQSRLVFHKPPLEEANNTCEHLITEQ